MKKLIALIAIIAICVSGVFAAKVNNPFKFSMDARFMGKVEDQWDLKSISSDTYITDAGATNKVKWAYLETTFSGTGKATIVKGIYDMSLGIAAQIRAFDNALGGSSSVGRVQYFIKWGNSFTVIKDYLSVGFDMSFGHQWDGDSNQNKVGTGALYDRGAAPDWYNLYNNNGTNRTNIGTNAVLSLSGKIKSVGFSWKVSEELGLQLHPEFYKDNNPQGYGKTSPYAVDHVLTDTAGEWNTNYGKVSGTLTAAQEKNFGHIIDSFNVITGLDLGFEFFHFFAPENITCTIKYKHKLKIDMPYSFYFEMDKEFENDMQPGIEFGLAGPKLLLGMRIRTYHYYNASAPMNGDNGSDWSYNGKAFLENLDASGEISPSHMRSWYRFGPTIGFSFSKDWFEIGGLYQGYLRDLGEANVDYDNWDVLQGVNNNTNWRNDFDIYAKIKI